MKALSVIANNRVKCLTAMLLLFTAGLLHGQNPVYPYFYRIYFRDKGITGIGEIPGSDLMSPLALKRREKAGIAVPDFKDLPVNRIYTDRISQLGLKLHTTSKWMNTALFKSVKLIDINTLLTLPFVSEVKLVKSAGTKSVDNNKLNFNIIQSELPPYNTPVVMVNGESLHNSGFIGKGILIAVLDGGFTGSDVITSLNNLRGRHGIRATYDFVNKTKSVFNSSTHGTAVLSILAGSIPGVIEGTAQGADYLLLKTEDVESEFPCEEDFWAAGAEYADSLGADIISSSLGYFSFDDPSLNYKSSSLDGNAAFVTRVADIAASKGILVVNSAGNERGKTWKKIVFPADGDSVLAIGAVDANRSISDFSSEGPSADRRIKPDIAAMGVSVTVQTGSLTGRSNGTSFSCPVISGMAACLMQAVPLSLNNDIIEVLHSSSDRYDHPDSLYGYGIPDFISALEKLQKKFIFLPDERVIIFPNPSKGSFEVLFKSSPENFTVELISMTGRLLFNKTYSNYAGRSVAITDLQKREQGIYFLRITDPSGTFVRKIIKLNN